MHGPLTPEFPALYRGGRRWALLAALAVAVLPAAVLPPAAAGDDTELFRESTAEPYVFFLLDVSGSMNQSVPCSAEQAKAGQCGNVTCTQAQIDAGTCPVYCPTGACLPRMMGDDAFSRFGVAKEAIYEIARRVDDVNFGFGQFGENLSVEGLLEDTVCIGDVYRVGEALLQVTQGRIPCYKLEHKMQTKGFITRFSQSLRSGFYFAVLETGTVGAGDAITLEQADPARLTVREVFELMLFDQQNPVRLERALQVPALSETWQGVFGDRLAKAQASQKDGQR